MKRISARSSVKKSKSYISKKNSKKLLSRGTKKYLSKYIFTFAIIFISVMFLGGFWIYKYFNQEFASAMTYSSYSIQNDPYPSVLYVVVEDMNVEDKKIKRIEYKVFDRDLKKSITYVISNDLEVDAPGRFGNEKISSLITLGGLNSENSLYDGVNMLRSSVFSLFAFKVDKFVLVDEKLQFNLDNIWNGSSILGFMSLDKVSLYKTSLLTDFSLKEFYSIYSLTSSLPSDRFFKYNINSLDDINVESSDENFQNMTFSSELIKENLSISLLNGTSQPGLATFATRVVNNYGGRVVASNNALNTYDESYIITSDINSLTVGYLSRVFNIKDENIYTKSTSPFSESEIERSDVTVILGFDTADVL